MDDLISLTLPDKVNEFVSCVFGGQHHLRKLLDMGGYFVAIPWGTVATYDDNTLTKIVLASHRLGLRAEIDNYGMRGIKILLHNRVSRDGMLHKRHPTIHEVLDA